MKRRLLKEFERFKNIENNNEEITDITNLSPTITLALICSQKLSSEIVSQIRKIEPQKGYFGFENEIISQLNIPESNKNAVNFIFHELTSNVYDHSKFTKGYVMGKTYGDFKEIGFIDNDITIPALLKNAGHSFENDCIAILEAVNGLSTKNDLGFIER